ncbi:hypothetical protein C8R43DRAFT_1102854 [Mycena crocata]|nr:hypothetical protein C8R43DRAFT_1102854 [Mycena crocata]
MLDIIALLKLLTLALVLLAPVVIIPTLTTQLALASGQQAHKLLTGSVRLALGPSPAMPTPEQKNALGDLPTYIFGSILPALILCLYIQSGKFSTTILQVVGCTTLSFMPTLLPAYRDACSYVWVFVLTTPPFIYAVESAWEPLAKVCTGIPMSIVCDVLNLESVIKTAVASLCLLVSFVLACAAAVSAHFIFKFSRHYLLLSLLPPLLRVVTILWKIPQGFACILSYARMQTIPVVKTGGIYILGHLWTITNLMTISRIPLSINTWQANLRVCMEAHQDGNRTLFEIMALCALGAGGFCVFKAGQWVLGVGLFLLAILLSPAPVHDECKHPDIGDAAPRHNELVPQPNGLMLAPIPMPPLLLPANRNLIRASRECGRQR